WIMFVAMAVARFWDLDWERYDKVENLYTMLRDKRGYDNLDEYIMDEVLDVHGDEAEALQELVGDCAERVKHALFALDVEAGTVEAWPACRSCIRWAWPSNLMPWAIT
ncbi:MAG: hypothetical protein IJ879_11300, partial [Muribaculaceae bacterium]|nr:hypothetical protein [Muribaculaceae bacterium]